MTRPPLIRQQGIRQVIGPFTPYTPRLRQGQLNGCDSRQIFHGAGEVPGEGELGWGPLGRRQMSVFARCG
jgi:hypothetical protein